MSEEITKAIVVYNHNAKLPIGELIFTHPVGRDVFMNAIKSDSYEVILEPNIAYADDKPQSITGVSILTRPIDKTKDGANE